MESKKFNLDFKFGGNIEFLNRLETLMSRVDKAFKSSEAEIDKTIEVLPGIISTLRKLSPYWKDGKPQIQGLDHDFDADSKEVRA